jgi:septum formation protein
VTSGGPPPAPRRIVLASASPRRRELLRLIAPEFDVVVPEVAELTAGDPGEVVAENARRKALAVAERNPDALVVGCDTEVALDGAVLGKPEDEAGARDRLERLSGRAHEVLSGVAVAAGGGVEVEVARTAVAFRSLSAAEVDAYVASGEWRDRAGGYAVQGLGSALVERVDGDLSTVIGLPIPALSRMIARLQDR